MGTRQPLPVDTGPPPDGSRATSLPVTPVLSEPDCTPPTPPSPDEGDQSSNARAVETTPMEMDSSTTPTSAAHDIASLSSSDPTCAEASDDPQPSSSKAFEEDGDADMTNGSPSTPKVPFSSALQEAAAATKMSTADNEPPATLPEGKPVSSQASPTSRPAPPKPTGARRSKPATTPAPRPQRQHAATPAASPAEGGVWSKSGTARIRSLLRGLGSAPMNPPVSVQQAEPTNPALLGELECVRKSANLRDDGDQRPMTKLESTVLYKILAKHLDVAKLPQFLLETHTSAERDVLEDFHRDHLGWLLYLLLPPGTKLSETNAKYSLLQLLLLSCGDDLAVRAEVDQLYLDVWSIRCEAKSGIAVFRFVRREVRDAWAGRALKLGRHTVTLKATDSLSTAVPRAGKDEAARGLLYHVYLRGPMLLKHADLRAIVATVAQTIAYHVEYVEAIGANDRAGPRWKVSFNQITCPKAFENVRRIRATLNGEELEYEVHHPRASFRTPCNKCLSVRHLTADCKNTRVNESLARHTRTVVVTTGPGLPKLTAITAPKHMDTQLTNLRHVAAPALEARLKAEEVERQAEMRRQTKLAAEAAAREAAAEARLQKAAKDHVTQDARRRERERARVARQRVTAQLRDLHKKMRDLHLRQLAAAPKPHEDQSEELAVTNNPDGAITVVDSQAAPPGAPRTDALITQGQTNLKEDEDRNEQSSHPPGEEGPPAEDGSAHSKSQADDVQAEPETAPSFELLTVVTTPKRPGKRSAPTSPLHAPDSVHIKKWQHLGAEHEGYVELRQGTGAPPARVDGSRRQPRQLGLLAFYAPQTRAEAQAQLEHEEAAQQQSSMARWIEVYPSPQLDAILEDLRSPATVGAWMNALGARCVNVPGTGGCLYFAIHGCRTRHIRGDEMRLLTSHVRESTFYKTNICTLYLEYLEPMAIDGTLSLTDLNRRYYGLGRPTDQKAATKAIKAFITGI